MEIKMNNNKKTNDDVMNNIEKINQEEKCTLKKLKMKAIGKIELFYL